LGGSAGAGSCWEGQLEQVVVGRVS
jgi:hypothetical protein